ncbi:MAG TPA: ATP-binding protein [Chloroflexota bacterium]
MAQDGRLRLHFSIGTAAACAVGSLVTVLAVTRGDVPAVLLAAVVGAILGGGAGLLLAQVQVKALIGIAAARQPIADAEGAAARLIQQPDVLSTVLSAMLDGVVLLDADGRLVFSNATARRLLPVRADGAMSDGDPVPRFMDERFRAMAKRALQGEILDETVELDDGRQTLRLHAVPLARDSAGVVLVLHDMTEARRLDRVRQEFVANASHELLTPIGTVRALADTLARGGMEDRKAARRFLKQLRVEADRLTALARDLVDLAQAQADELRLDLKPTDVSEVIATVLERLHTPAAKAGVTLDAIWGASPPPVLADAARLEQVLINLAQNAIKFTGAGGRVTLTTEARQDDVLIRVADTGVGIAPDDLARIFERFYKVRGASGSAGGTGLGLAIVRHLMAAMQGAVTAESQPGRGSTFTVTLRRAHTATEGSDLAV